MRLTHHRSPRPVRGPRRGERGFVLAKFALLLVPLLLMSGLSVDVGSWYSRASDIQKAADAAALAGVVWLPNFEEAETRAVAAARRNGFVSGQDNISIRVEQTGERRLKVTITDGRVESFLWGNLGGHDLTMARSGSAEYVLPVKMGSPESFIGNDPTASGYPAGAPNLWASISGPTTAKVDGDPYSTYAGGNSEYRDWGYLYLVDITPSQVNRPMTLQVYDAGNYARTNYPNVETADYGTVNTSFELFSPDDTPLDQLDGLRDAYSMNGRCSTGSGRWRISNNTSSGTYRNKWVTLCTWTPPAAGKWVLQVKSSSIPGITNGGNGWNQFALRVTTTGATPRPALYTVGDLSIFNNLPGRSGNINASFYLAEIDEEHAGKTLEVSLFDPGDGKSGTYHANIRGPGNTTLSCRYKERTSSTWITSSNCRITTRSNGTNVYNGKWLDIQVAVPATYSCTDCWWKVLYEFQGVTSGNSPNDRTVWSARVIGDPVHLVEEEAP